MTHHGKVQGVLGLSLCNCEGSLIANQRECTNDTKKPLDSHDATYMLNCPQVVSASASAVGPLEYDDLALHQYFSQSFCDRNRLQNRVCSTLSLAVVLTDQNQQVGPQLAFSLVVPRKGVDSSTESVEPSLMNASEQNLPTDLSRIYCFPPISIYRRNLVKISWTSLAAYSNKKIYIYRL